MMSGSSEKLPIRVALIEDDEELRAALTHRIGRSPQFHLVRSYPTAEAAIADIPRSRPEVVLVDINLPGIDGVECVRQLKAKLPQVQFMMLTVYEDSNRLFNSLVAGASGYLLKRTSLEKLREAIQEVYEGGAPMTPGIARLVVQHFQRQPDSAVGLNKLAPREKEVLDQLSRGFRYKEIEANLNISSGTLHTYIRNIYEKLQVHSRTEAVVKYLNG